MMKQLRNTKVKRVGTKLQSSISLLFIFPCLAAFLNAQDGPELDPINLLLSNSKVQKATQATVKQAAVPKQSLVTDSVPLNFAAKAEVEFQQAQLDVPNTSHDAKEDLLKMDMASFKTDDDKHRIELQKIIKQINSVEFKSTEKKPESIITIEPMTLSESNEITVDAKEEGAAPQVIQKTEIHKKLQKLLSLSKKPDDPLEFAEILFMGNYMKEAAVFYQQALEQTKADEAKYDRAWILFQIGNCLKTDDAKTAKTMYRQLINEYPDSTWTELAKVEDKMIEWYQINKPKEVNQQ